ncbi:hypothetical protein HMPREF9353_01056 [Treponema denticola F0402]|nr:hypothetical protein HMPREF9353_01056 [Treponema denticola F0402]
MNKIKSRKFQVFIIWLILVIFSFLINNIQVSTQEIILQFFGRVSIIYIGGNVFQKYIEGRKNE